METTETTVSVKRPLPIVIAAILLAAVVIFGLVALFLNPLKMPSRPNFTRYTPSNTTGGGSNSRGGAFPGGGFQSGGGGPSTGSAPSGGGNGPVIVQRGDGQGGNFQPPSDGNIPPDGVFVGPDGGGFPGGGANSNNGLPNIPRSGRTGTTVNQSSTVRWVALAVGVAGLILGLVAVLGLLRLKMWGVILALVASFLSLALAVIGFLMPAARGLTWSLLTNTGSSFQRFIRYPLIRVATPGLYWQYLLPVVLVIAVVALVLLPVSRKAIAQKRVEEQSFVV